MSHILTAKNVHFTGIKGVGMTAAALCVQDRGAIVSGSDLEDVFHTDKVLADREIPVKIGFTPENIDKDTDMLVYTGAHGGVNNPEVVYAKQNGITAISHAEAVGQLMYQKFGFSVCGVGGKTTTSAMIATILEYADKNPSYLVGVASIKGLEYPGRYSNSKCFVAEADEYATSPGIDNTPRFMFHTPNVIVCTNIIHDHPDVYQNIDQVMSAYSRFFQKLPSDGLLVLNSDCANSVKVAESINIKKIFVGSKESSDYRIKETKIIDEQQHITIIQKDKSLLDLVINIPGVYNAKNAIMAYATLKEYGLGEEIIKKGLLEFKGNNRRFEHIGHKDGVDYYDDYAHHPEEIKATIKAARDWLPDKNLIVVFQPHTYSRTKVLFDQFSTSFEEADKVIITDIFASARENPDPSISGKLLADKISQIHPQASYVSTNDLVKYLETNQKSDDVIFTLGAGDVYKIHQQLIKKS